MLDKSRNYFKKKTSSSFHSGPFSTPSSSSLSSSVSSSSFPSVPSDMEFSVLFQIEGQ
jgi:hypothetical protein